MGSSEYIYIYCCSDTIKNTEVELFHSLYSVSIYCGKSAEEKQQQLRDDLMDDVGDGGGGR